MVGSRAEQFVKTKMVGSRAEQFVKTKMVGSRAEQFVHVISTRNSVFITKQEQSRRIGTVTHDFQNFPFMLQ